MTNQVFIFAEEEKKSSEPNQPEMHTFQAGSEENQNLTEDEKKLKEKTEEIERIRKATQITEQTERIRKLNQLPKNRPVAVRAVKRSARVRLAPVRKTETVKQSQTQIVS